MSYLSTLPSFHTIDGENPRQMDVFLAIGLFVSGRYQLIGCRLISPLVLVVPPSAAVDTAANAAAAVLSVDVIVYDDS